MYTIDLQTRTLYAELLEQMQLLDASRTISSLKGSFTIKNIGDENYVYFQHYTLGGKLTQLYIGKQDSNTEQLMREHTDGKADLLEMRDSIKRLGTQVVAGLKMHTDKGMTRVIRSLADSGVFRNSGVLVGTHAFQAIGVMLGVCWSADTMATSDVDVAAEKNVSVAIPQNDSDIPATLDSLHMGFFPVPRLSHKEPSTTFAVRKNRMRLDILTPNIDSSEAPVFIKRFNCAAQPLRYLGYLIESFVPAVLPDTEPVLVNIPHPARYALHKLIVSQVREVSSDAKRAKDLYQAYQMLSFLREDRPYDLKPAWDDLVSRGSSWKKHAENGFSEMERRYGMIPLDL
ncbi:MAG: nucleotidyltransferase domain-containing protein [Pelobacteraceae bacterium]